MLSVYCLILVLSALCSQIKKLNAEIRGYTQQLKRVKGAAARGIKQRAVQALKRKKMYVCVSDGWCVFSKCVTHALCFSLSFVGDHLCVCVHNASWHTGTNSRGTL